MRHHRISTAHDAEHRTALLYETLAEWHRKSTAWLRGRHRGAVPDWLPSLAERSGGLLGLRADAPEICPACGIDAIEAEVSWLARTGASDAPMPEQRKLCGCCAAVLLEELSRSPDVASLPRLEPMVP